VVGLKLDEQIDLLIGGFPCTNLSIAKKNREGLAGSQSGLFYEMIRVHKEVRPKYFVYENVFSMAKDQKDIITQTVGELMQCPCGCGEWGSLDRCQE
jgi:site-specific DNA-cytosine methylase